MASVICLWIADLLVLSALEFIYGRIVHVPMMAEQVHNYSIVCVLGVQGL